MAQTQISLSSMNDDFKKVFGSEAESTFFSPGRVNLIGEHIDYNGGKVLPAAITLGIYALINPNESRTIRLYSANKPNQGVIEIDLDEKIVFDVKHSWANYPKGVMFFLQEEGYQLFGADIYYQGNLPDGAGLSSSAAIEVLTTFMLLSVKGIEPDKVWLSKFCQKVENKFIGVSCGIMDQFAVALGKKQNAILLDCQTLAYDYAKMDKVLLNHDWVIMNSMKKRELAESKYNERRAECDMALEDLRTKYTLANLCEAKVEQVNELIFDSIIKKRALHAITENKRVYNAMQALKDGKIKLFGELLNASHYSLQNDYEVTGFELDALVSAAQNESSCVGARMTGAGFGGCAIALVEKDKLQSFTENVAKKYTQETKLIPEFYICSIGEGVHKL